MFEGFARVWTPVTPSRKVGKKPVSLVVAGERLVLFRGAGGAVSALLDRCPHRGVALSLGKVTAEGRLECPFHGWQFEPDGGCAKVPLNAGDEAFRERLSATALPARDLGGLVWVYTDPFEPPPTEPPVPDDLVAKGVHRWFVTQTWRAHWTRAMENMLDTPHVPYVHRRTIGLGLRRRLKGRPNAVMTIESKEMPFGSRSTWKLDGEDGVGALDWRPPNGMTLEIPIPKRRMHVHAWCVPAAPGETLMIVAESRDFGRFNPFVRAFDELNRLVLLEDRAIVESSDPPVAPDPAEERSVATDRFTLAFRRYWMRELEDSRVDPPPRPALVGLAARR